MSIREPTRSPKAAARRFPQFFAQHRKLTAVAIILLALVGIYVWPLLDKHPEQDTCSFGPVSNERYRELLAEAKRRQATIWPAIRDWDARKTNAVLNERFDDLSRGMTSAYERLAAMHAVARALGSDYRHSGFGIDNPYPKAIQGAGLMPFEYHADLNRLYFFSPFRRQLRLGGFLVVRDGVSVVQDQTRSGRGDVEFSVLFPWLLENYNITPRSQFGEACPLVPEAALAESLRRALP